MVWVMTSTAVACIIGSCVIAYKVCVCRGKTFRMAVSVGPVHCNPQQRIVVSVKDRSLS